MRVFNPERGVVAALLSVLHQARAGLHFHDPRRHVDDHLAFILDLGVNAQQRYGHIAPGFVADSHGGPHEVIPLTQLDRTQDGLGRDVV